MHAYLFPTHTMIFRTRTVVSSLALLLVLAGCSTTQTVEEPTPPAEEQPVPPMEDIVPPPEEPAPLLEGAVEGTVEGSVDEGTTGDEVPAEGAPEGGEVPAAE